MNLSTGVVSALQLKRCEVPLELQANFAGLRHVPLFFAGHIRKLNHRGAVQDRVLIATLDHIYVCDPNGDILRCFPYSRIETVLVDPHRQQMALVVPQEYDVAFSTADHHKLLHVIEVVRGLHHCAAPFRVETLPAPTTNEEEAADDNSPQNEKSKKPEGGGGFFSRISAWASGKRKADWFSGPAESNCIGRGYYKVNLQQPSGFVLDLKLRNS